MTDVRRIHTADGFDVTEGVQVILDAFAHGMEAGSGFLDYREMCAIRQVAAALGLDPNEFVSAARYENASTVAKDGTVTRTTMKATWPNPASPLTDGPDSSQVLALEVESRPGPYYSGMRF